MNRRCNLQNWLYKHVKQNIITEQSTQEWVHILLMLVRLSVLHWHSVFCYSSQKIVNRHEKWKEGGRVAAPRELFCSSHSLHTEGTVFPSSSFLSFLLCLHSRPTACSQALQKCDGNTEKTASMYSIAQHSSGKEVAFPFSGRSAAESLSSRDRGIQIAYLTLVSQKISSCLWTCVCARLYTDSTDVPTKRACHRFTPLVLRFINSEPTNLIYRPTWRSSATMCTFKNARFLSLFFVAVRISSKAARIVADTPFFFLDLFPPIHTAPPLLAASNECTAIHFPLSDIRTQMHTHTHQKCPPTRYFLERRREKRG